MESDSLHPRKRPPARPDRSVYLAFLIGLLVLGMLSLRQHYQIQALKAATRLDARHYTCNNNQIVRNMVDLQRSLNQSHQQVDQIARFVEGAEEALDRLAGGVCLIQGEYIFIDSESQQPLRRLDEQTALKIRNNPLSRPMLYVPDRQVEGGSMAVGSEGIGPPLVVRYSGTGFLIDSQGYIVTNKHITRPWQFSQEYQGLLRAGYEPQLLLFRAFFPNQSRPFDLDITLLDPEEDIALLYGHLGGAGIPVLPCCTEPGGLKMGHTVVVLGYPTGFDLLLARMKPSELAEILGVGEESNFDTMALNMAARGLIQPLATRGMCGRICEGRILYDAPTAIGGSGAPVIGINGEVVAINTALLKGFDGTNFGIPIGRVLELLREVTAGQK